MSVLVTDGEERVGYNVMKSLGKNGIKVTACSKTKLSASSFSKYCHKHFTYPDPSKNTKSFLRRMLQEVKSEEYEILMPVSDFSVIPISEFANKFRKYTKIPIASHESILKAYNKIETFKIGLENGIPCPQIIFPKNSNDLKGKIENLDFPVVIKPTVTQKWKDGRTKHQKVEFAYSEKDLFEKYKKMFDKKYPPMIQEYIPGRGYGFFGLYNNSELRACFVHKRLREFPVGKGASTLRESVKNQKVRKFGDKLLRSMNWHGVAMVEFRMDPRDRKPKLMEVNGRFWGSLNLPISSGVNFPYLLYKMAMEGDIEPVFNYKIGVKSRWLMGDIFRILSLLSGNYDRRSVKNMKILNEIKEFMEFKQKKMYYDMFSTDDPIPGFINLLYSFNRTLKKLQVKES